jgi:hypothetical protein
MARKPRYSESSGNSSGEGIIYESGDEQASGGIGSSQIEMTDRERARGQEYRDRYLIRKGEVEEKYLEEWNDLLTMYACVREKAPVDDPQAPRSFIPLVTPCVEGQVASMIEGEIDFVHTTNNPAHEAFMAKIDAASAYIRKQNNFLAHFKDHTRYYDLLGNALIYVSWEPENYRRGGPNGCARISVPALNTVFFDGRIKDSKDIQHSLYIIHAQGFIPLEYIRQEYGDEVADGIAIRTTPEVGPDPDVAFDDTRSALLLFVWTRSNKQKNLQLIEMDETGYIFRESDPSEPFYKNVDNQYPFYLTRMIPQLGQLYGYGDGRILAPMQDVVNKLTDELELAAKFSAQSQLIIDPRAKMKPGQLNSDPRKFAVGENPRNNILQLTGTGINAVVPNFIEFLLREAQRVTRFSDIMTGQQGPSSATATAIQGQLSQGSVGIKDKRSDISRAMEWTDRYCINLALEKWDAPFWSRMGEGAQRYVDPAELDKVPEAIPATAKFVDDYVAQNKDNKEAMKRGRYPTWQTLEGNDGKLVLTQLDYDTQVDMGPGIPHGKTDMYNMILGLLQVQPLDPATGAPREFLTLERGRELMERALGFQLRTEDERDQSEMQEEAPPAPPPAPVGVNPASDAAVQMPTGGQVSAQNAGVAPPNLMSTVPGTAQMDKRGMQM